MLTSSVFICGNNIVFYSCLFQKKKCAVFEVAEVLPVMTNNYEESILKGAKVSIFQVFIFIISTIFRTDTKSI